MIVRNATIEEFDKVVDFYDNIIDDMQGSKYHPMWQKRIYPTLDFLKESIANGQLYIQIVNGNIVGCMVMNNFGNGYDTVSWSIQLDDEFVNVIHALGISVKEQGKGYAKALVQESVKIAKNNGARVIRLDVLAPNLPAHELYKKCGFELRETKDLFYEDTGWTQFMLYELVL